MQQVPDYRHIRGRRHELWLVLLLILLGAMTGYWGYRPLEDFTNDYLIGLKENQPKLYKMAQTQLLQSPPLSCATAIDSGHSRIVKRTCQVFAVPESLQNQWAGLKTFVVVERQGERHRQPFHECQFYICSQHLEAQQLLADTQGHWGIENRLHWVKDVTCQGETLE